MGFVGAVIVAFFLCICCTIHGHSPPGVKHTSDDLDTEDTRVQYDEGDTLTNIDSISPTTNLDSVTPVVYRNPSQLSALTSLSHSSSVMDVQYRPVSHLKGMLGLLVLYAITWTCGALAVALPFDFIHQEIVFNCLYLLFSIALGVFILVYFVFGRKDGRIAWRRTCCCDKSEDYDLNQSGSTNLHSGINGHLVQSASSIEGSQYTNKSSSNTNRSGSYRYGPMGQLDRSDVSILNSNVPTITDTSVMQEYPNFFNEKQNGIAKKYWQKTRQKQRIAQLNKELKNNAGARHKDANSRVSFDDSSDQNTHISLEIQLEPQAFSKGDSHLASMEQNQNLYNSLTRQIGVAIDGPCDNLRRPLVPYTRYQIAPMVGMSSPPSSTLLPPDGGSCISTEISSHVIPPAPMTSPQSSAISCMPPSSHSLPRPGKHVIPHYMQRNGSVPRLRDFDGKSSTSRDTRPLSIGSDSQTMDSYKQLAEISDHPQNGQHYFPQPDSRLLYTAQTGSNSNRNNNGKGSTAYNAFGNNTHRGISNGYQHAIVSDNVQSMCIDEEPSNLNDFVGYHKSQPVAAKPPVIPKSRTGYHGETVGEHKHRKSRDNSHNPKHHRRKGSSGGQFVEPPVSSNTHSSNIAKVVRTNSGSLDETAEQVTVNTGLLQKLDNDTTTPLNVSVLSSADQQMDSEVTGQQNEEKEGLLQQERLNILNGNTTAATDIWLPQHQAAVKAKNMETCV